MAQNPAHAHGAALANLDVVILAGGLGTRLRGLLPDQPKCLAPIGGRPFLFYLLDRLSSFGARRVIFSLGYKAEQVNTALASSADTWPALALEHFIEPTPLGTGGALRAMLPRLRAQKTLVLNGDSLVCAPLDALVNFHHDKNARLCVLTTYLERVGASGVVSTQADGAVLRFAEKPAAAGQGGFINAGVYLFERETIATLPHQAPLSLEKEVFPTWIGSGFFAFQGQFPFIDIGTPENYARAPAFFLKNCS
jgi:D-glycero-alpha-D-manno-heptose 1-phosphate guanylyltransferase